jgi:7,8-dihydropterin-6-yl-methyl-4-(beta-D-ribofuranosyl)aminobenzene 5'-phosphate synthase
MKFTVSVLMENTPSQPKFKFEHGLSLLIETPHQRILFDTGESSAFLENADLLQKDVRGVDALVLSHCHHDHTGGLSALLALEPPPKVIYVGKHFFDARYRREDGLLRPNGSHLSERDIRSKGLMLRLCDSPLLPLFEGVYLMSGFSSIDPNEVPLPYFLRESGGNYVTDLFVEELALVLMTDEGPALISGCAHNGVVSTCQIAADLLGEPVRIFIGGTHLQAANAARIEYSLEALRKLGIKRLGACHCNGSEANAYFAKNFENFFANTSGTVSVL